MNKDSLKQLVLGLTAFFVHRKTLHDGYIEYTLLYDMIANRITINEVRAENGCLRLMKNLVWEYDALPHALIAGGTGGGKTYFLLTLIEALLHTNAVLYILDPKNSDLADLGTVMPNVYHTKEEMINQYVRFVDEEPGKRKNDWKLNDRWAWFIGDNRQSLKLTTKPEPYTLDRTLRWVQRQVAPTLKMLKKIDKGNGTDYMETIEQQAKLTEKHEMIIKQQTTPAKDLVES